MINWNETESLQKVDDSDGQDGDYSGDGDEDACALFQAMKNIFQQHVTKDEAKEGRDLTNKMWSPLSLYMAISILYMGTAGNTRKQLGKNKSVLLRGGDKLIISKFLNIVLIRQPKS